MPQPVREKRVFSKGRELHEPPSRRSMPQAEGYRYRTDMGASRNTGTIMRKRTASSVTKATQRQHVATTRPALPCPAVSIVYNGERLNALARSRWAEFSLQNYFDKWVGPTV